MITLLCILIFLPFILLEFYLIDKISKENFINYTKTKLEKNGYFATKEDIKKFNKYLNDFFGVDILNTKIIVFNEKIKIFKVKDNFILADGMTLKVISNDSEILTFLECKEIKQDKKI